MIKLTDILNQNNLISESINSGKIFGKTIKVNSGIITVDNVKYYADRIAGAVKRGSKPSALSNKALYTTNGFPDQLQGNVYYFLYESLKQSILKNLSEDEIQMAFDKVTRGDYEAIVEFCDYLKLELPEY